MSAPRRRSLPDNLDPLVDTLSNVVGILVIVVALTQLELSDAAARVAKSLAGRAVEAEAIGAPELAAPDPGAEEALARRRDRLRARGGDDSPATADRLERVLAGLRAQPAAESAKAARDAIRATSGVSREALEAQVARARQRLETARKSRAERRRHAGALERVPARLVARLPDPRIVQGREKWMLVRFGRVYLVDREPLFDQGRRAIERIVPDGAARRLRPDEFESVAHYLRKSDIGLGPFRWQLKTEPDVHLELDWRTRDGGIERSSLATSPELAEWLARQDPAGDVIRFHVWNDSFETYLEARTRVEAAGFRASWIGHDAAEELPIRLSFGARLPEVRPIEFD